MKPLHWRGVTLVAVVSAAALVVSTAMIAALVKDPVWIAVAIQRGDTAALAQAILDALAAAARAILRWL
jgi:hypothetical protein